MTFHFLLSLSRLHFRHKSGFVWNPNIPPGCWMFPLCRIRSWRAVTLHTDDFRTCRLCLSECRGGFTSKWKKDGQSQYLQSCKSWTYHWHTNDFCAVHSGHVGGQVKSIQLPLPAVPPWLTRPFLLRDCPGIQSIFHFSERALMCSWPWKCWMSQPSITWTGEIFQQLLLPLTCKWHSSVRCLWARRR